MVCCRRLLTHDFDRIIVGWGSASRADQPTLSIYDSATGAVLLSVRLLLVGLLIWLAKEHRSNCFVCGPIVERSTVAESRSFRAELGQDDLKSLWLRTYLGMGVVWMVLYCHLGA